VPRRPSERGLKTKRKVPRGIFLYSCPSPDTLLDMWLEFKM